MGRGRAKAKQTKVARALKYSSPDTDLEALQRELSKQRSEDRDEHHNTNVDGDDDDYEEWASKRS